MVSGEETGGRQNEVASFGLLIVLILYFFPFYEIMAVVGSCKFNTHSIKSILSGISIKLMFIWTHINKYYSFLRIWQRTYSRAGAHGARKGGHGAWSERGR